MKRLIKAGLRYWTALGTINSTDELIQYNMAIEKAYRLRHGREPKRANRTMAMDTDWTKDSFPDAVNCRIARMKDYERIVI